MGCCPDYCRDPPTGVFYQGWMYPFVDLLFPGFYFLGFERYVPVRFPSSRFGVLKERLISQV